MWTGIGLSGVLGGPQNSLEIIARAHDGSTYTGKSGLRFRQLTKSSAIGIAPYGKVLTVDSLGDALLTDNTGYSLCSSLAVVSGDMGMALHTYHIYYDGNGYTGNPLDMNNSIGLGYGCSAVLPGKLSVDQSYVSGNVDDPTVAGYFHNGDKTIAAASSFEKRGVYSISSGQFSNQDNHTWNLINIGGDFKATNCDVLNIGVRGIVDNSSNNNAGTGGWFEANKNLIDNIGVYAFSDGTGSGVNYGIYAFTPGGSCGTGSCSDAAGFFNGDVYTTSTTYYTSDANLKTNIQPLQNGMSIINQLKPKTFSFRTNQFPYINLPSGSQDGLIAQDVQNILPGLVGSFKIPPRTDSIGNMDTTGIHNSYLAVNYVGIIPYLIAGVKEQQLTIDSMRANDLIRDQRLNDLETRLNNCCGTGRNPGDDNGNTGDNRPGKHDRTTTNIELSNVNTIILDQNSPNPFKDETFINYKIPKEVLKASIMIYDNLGQVLKTVIIKERGDGMLHI